MIEKVGAADESADRRPSLTLHASRDRTSGHGVFPRIPEHSPAAARFQPITLSDVAALYSFTVIHPNPKTGQAPFALIYADFPEDVRVFGRLDLAGDDRPRIGMAVRAVTDEAAATDGDVNPAYRFVAAEETVG
ncbi:Zn-ribbon domain-containing OB-fold protein [Sphingomonas arantia]|uniref:Zn-ribbon domain-containing OB-fold protein n=1 Tax=Sphingomonas arantia TaxID=1460676 RepID=A0ABW4U2V1_9SPHN